MIAAGLIETSVALAVSAGVAALMLASAGSQMQIALAAVDLSTRIVEARALDHLIDATLSRAAGTRLAEAGDEEVVVYADIDGDGSIDARSAERTVLILRASGAHRRLLHRQGRQSMAVAEDLPADAAWELRDRFAARTVDPSRARLLVRPRNCGPAECDPNTTALPAATSCRCRRLHAVGTS